MAKLGLDKVVESVAALSGLSQRECRAVISDYIYVIRTALLNGMEVELKGLGCFGLRYKPPKEPRLMPDVTKGGEMSWSKPKEEYNQPIFTMYKAFAGQVREATEGHAFKPNKKKGNKVECTMTPEEYAAFAERIDKMNFDDEDFVGEAEIERDVVYDRL